MLNLDKVSRTIDAKGQIALVEAQRDRIAEIIKKNYGFDMKESVIDGSCFARMYNLVEAETGEVPFQEASATGTLAMMTRYGTQSLLTAAYQQPAVAYPSLFQIKTSGSRAELYYDTLLPEEPLEVKMGSPFKNSNLTGDPAELINVKYGRVISFFQELFEDDQTGQIGDKITSFGQRVRIKEERVAMKVVDDTTPNTTRYTNAIGNKVATYGAPTQALLEEALTKAEDMKDANGNEIVMVPNFVLGGTSTRFLLEKLLMSAEQSAVPSAVAGAVGYVGTYNPLKNAGLTIYINRFINTNRWFVGQAKTSLIFQDRTPLQSTVEASDSGESFNNDTIRVRIRRRCAAGCLSYRFIVAGKAD